MTRLIQRLLTNRNQWLLVSFGAFLFLILFFAVLYYSAYRKDRSNFLFAADLSGRQSEVIAAEARSKLSGLVQLKSGVRGAISRLAPSDTGRMTHLGVRRFPAGPGLTVGAGIESGGGDTYLRTFFLEESSGRRIEAPVEFEASFRRLTPSQLLNEQLDDLESDVAAIEAQLSTIQSAYPDLWSFGDFLYFSVITQGTVGYGDILPNSEYIRVLVTVQVLTSYLIVLVLINWIVVRTSADSVTRSGA